MRTLFTFVIAAAFLAAAGAQSPSTGLRIVVIEGENAVNVIQRRTAVAPVVEVRDNNNLPVAGVSVTFALNGSKAAALAGGAQSVTVTTNAAGRAVLAGLTPISGGPVQIHVTAALQGQAATAVISQTNVMTAAQAAAAGGSTAAPPGGGVSKAVIAGAGGAAAAGAAALVVATKDPESRAPALSIAVDSAAVGIRSVTQFTFAANGGNVLSPSYAWLFGDGSSGSGMTTTYTYNNDGTFTVTLRAIGAGQTEEATATVRVGSLTGTWVQETQNHIFRLVMAQQGQSLSGQWFVDGRPGFPSNVSPLSGSVTGSSTVTVAQGGECLRSMTLTANSDLTALTGSVSSPLSECSGANGVATFTRQ